MEEMFESNDLKKLALFLEMPENSSYSNIMTSIICSSDETIEKCLDIVSSETKDNFNELFNMINSVYSSSQKPLKAESEMVGV